MGTNTTNYSFSKPTVDGDEDTWGTQLNGNWDKTDSLLSGGQDISSLSITTSVTLKGQADLVLKDADSSHSVSLQAPATIASNYTLTMPTGDGSNGQVLTTDGSGGLSFTTITGFSGAFGDLTGKPTTIAGYGITDALQLGTTATTALAGNTSIPSTLTDLGISDGTNGQALKTDGSGNFSFGDVTSSVAFADITSKPTTLSGYGITDAVRRLSTATSPDYQTPSSRRVDPNSSNPTNEHYAITTFGNGDNVTGQIAAHFQTGQLYSRGYNNSFSAWRKIWNDANDGSGSGLDADKLDGYHASTTRNSANTIPIRNSSGYLDLGWINTTSGNTGSNSIDRVYSSYDGYIRYSSATKFLHRQGLSYYRAYDWIEFRDTGAGVYWSNSTGAGWHIYPVSTSTMRLRSGSTSCTIRLNTNGADRNYIYQNANNEIGFLTTGGGWLFRCYNNGNVVATGNVTAYSDIRLKTDIVPIEGALDRVSKLEGVEYTRTSTGEREIGFIAQNVITHEPTLVDVVDASTEKQEALPDLHVMKYQNTTALLVEAVKELKAEVDTLRQEIAELKKEV